MDFGSAIRKAPIIFALAEMPEPKLGLHDNFDRYSREAAYAARNIIPSHRPEWLKDWAIAWRKLRDEWDRIVASDPMVAYRPLNRASLEFHRSDAFIRYFRAGNRTSKTQSGYAEHYFCVTGNHPYRETPPWPASTLIVSGLPFTDYAPRVFEKKMLLGEDGPNGKNPLSPMFPEGGKWFYKYDSKKYSLTLACPECASKGTAGGCPSHHKKATISLVSSEKGVDVIEAFSVRIAHGDEHIPGDFYKAMQMRVADQKGGGLIFTGTPLHGTEAWEAKDLTAKAEAGIRKNPEDPNSPLLVSLHWCTQWDGNVVSHDAIRAIAQTYDDFEVESRIEGRPAPLAKNPVFDRKVLQIMRKYVADPKRGKLDAVVPLVELKDKHELRFISQNLGPLRVWEPPKEGAQYIVAVDTAAGLAKGDPSCASVLRLDHKSGQLRFKMVAQYHGWIPIHEYADEVFRLAVWYNSAMAIVELTGGLGRAVVERLRKELFYWNIFRSTEKGEYAEFRVESRFGVDTSAASKPSMIAITQQILKAGRLQIFCADTIQELVAYEQEKTDFGNTRYRGAGGSHDDRAMSIVIGVSTAISNGIFDVTDLPQEIEVVKILEATGDDAAIWKDVHQELDAME